MKKPDTDKLKYLSMLPINNVNKWETYIQKLCKQYFIQGFVTGALSAGFVAMLIDMIR